MEGPAAKQKRTRGENWLDEDKNLLLELIKERVHDLENKNTDTNTNNKKKNAWVAVNESFNSMCKGGHRTTAQLKGQWGQTKVNKKKEICALRKELFKTGGGGPPQIPPDNSQDITAWLPQEFTIDNNEFDSDNPIVIGGNSTVETTSPIPPMKEEYTVVIEQDVGLQHDKENAMPKHESIIDDKKEKKVKKSEKKKDFASQKIDEIAEAELKLHSAKMRNQERKARNLDLEYEVLQAKLDYYKNKKDKQQEK